MIRSDGLTTLTLKLEKKLTKQKTEVSIIYEDRDKNIR